MKYGDFLKKSDLQELKKWRNQFDTNDTSNYALVMGLQSRCGNVNPGILNGVGIYPFEDESLEELWDLVPVYEVEWIDSDKRDGKWIGYCYHVTRIGHDIYVLD
jgi:hypothetical protein